MRVYVASSWRNTRYPTVLERLRAEDIPHYDFRNPGPGNDGFRWSDVSRALYGEESANDWQKAKAERIVEMLRHPIAARGFWHDFSAITDASAGLLVMPAGRSAHIEIGYIAGRGRPTCVLLDDESEAELMWKLTDLVTTSLDEAVEFLKR